MPKYSLSSGELTTNRIGLESISVQSLKQRTSTAMSITNEAIKPAYPATQCLTLAPFYELQLGLKILSGRRTGFGGNRDAVSENRIRR